MIQGFSQCWVSFRLCEVKGRQMRKILILCCVFLILTAASIVWSQSGGKTLDPSYKKIDVTDPLTALSSPIQSELSSVVAPPTSPLILKGVALGFLVLGVCCNSSKQVVLCGDNKTISWYDQPTTVNLSQFNTLTVTFSSMPPGPAYWYLGGGASMGTFSIDNTPIVLDKTTCPNCFSSSSALFTTFYISQHGSWTTVGTSSSKIS